MSADRDSGAEAAQETSLIVRDLPLTVRHHVTGYLGEQLYFQGFEQLQDVLLAGADLPLDTPRRIFLPSAQIISLACTLTVYPPLTSRLPSTRKPDAADKALQYFRQLTSTGRTTDLPLNEPLTFASQDPYQSSRRRRRSLADGLDKEDSDDRLSIKVKAANEDSIFVRAEDFWAVVGWAFNCSVKHIKRWERWRVWLDVMLDLLEKDLRDRSEFRSFKTNINKPDADKLIEDALLTRYLTLRASGRAEKRRIMRAILADGSKKSMAEFGPLWKNETMPPKEVDPNKLPGKKLDIENEQFGDYMDLDDDEDPETGGKQHGTSRRGKMAGQPDHSDDDLPELFGKATASEASTDYGGHSSMLLRQRILGLLASYCHLHPTYFVDVEDLFDICTEFLRPLPVQIFAQFILPAATYLDDDLHSVLIRNLMRPLLSVEAPVFRKAELEQADLERHFLPFAASRDNVTDNARVSLLNEALLRLLWKHDGLSVTPNLRKAVKTGCEARRHKGMFDGRKKKPADLDLMEYAKSVIQDSEVRMTLLLDVV
ncbi:hypothetical protein K461DRAFT_291977 [Myriangium duriaei CBS 260.36]|uniref:Uncharacterized protein n=1 Tax=Myriangium duriaei CBS 260.36 TaxID=1168546 RepID=A0A9P4J6R1_9PEZI|nr:hypothetical protein K461DRAFT_291977 [Myriangium duriaei CBS 260.36]